MKNKDFCNVVMPFEDTKVLEFNQHQKFDKALFIIYTDLECIIEKIHGYKSNPENLSTTKVSKHIPSGFQMSTISSFRGIKNKHDVYTGKDYLKKFSEFLGEHTMKIINFKKKKNGQQDSYKNAKSCYICKEKFENKYLKKFRDHCHYARDYIRAVHGICNLKYSVPGKILVAFHIESNYNYCFIIKVLAEELKKNLFVLEKRFKNI